MAKKGTERDALSPQETVDYILKRYNKWGKNDFVFRMTQQDVELVKQEINPYMFIDLKVDHEGSKEPAKLILVDKPFGVEFRTPRHNIKAEDPAKLEKQIVELVPPVDSEDINVTFSSGKGLVTVPYKAAYRQQVGLFINPDTVDELRSIGEPDVGGYFTIQNTINEVLEELLEYPDNYSVNEMHEGSLLHKTRENVEPGEFRNPPWVSE